NVSWILAATCLVWIMTPGVGFLYSGMARRKNALSLIMLCILTIPIVSIQYICGYSLAFSKTGGPFIGDLRNAFFLNLQWNSSEPEAAFVSKQIPEAELAIFECMFAVIASELIIGGAAERVKLMPMIIFIFIWSTLVYDFIASWCWSDHGWFTQWGGLDFAGGIPVYISSGAAALAFCIFLGRRRETSNPHNIVNVILGTLLLWFGWFGFNGGTAAASNSRAVMAFIVTNLAASFSGLTWMFFDYHFEKKLKAVSFCNGVVAGLVAITPGSGYVDPYAAVVFGVLSGFICNMAAALVKTKIKWDDAMDVFAIHGVGGFLGSILTGFFANKDTVFSLNGDKIDGGVINGNYIQIVKQLSGSCVGLAYSFTVTYIILHVMNSPKYLGWNIEVFKLDGTEGTDQLEMEESAY
ncbi:11519_t:CDS:2, partial [Racocetra persica]